MTQQPLSGEVLDECIKQHYADHSAAQIAELAGVPEWKVRSRVKALRRWRELPYKQAPPDVDGFRRYRERPSTIRAKQMSTSFEVETPKGQMKGKPGDFLVISVHGERYPVDRAIFRATYVEVRD